MELMYYIIAVCSLQIVYGADSKDTLDLQTQRQSRERRSTRNCHQKYQGISGHTACLGPSSSVVRSGVTASEKTTIVNTHNTYRSNVSPTAQDMLKMSWDDEVAMLAQNWAENCVSNQHDANYNRFIPGRLQLGQNMYWSSNKRTWESAIQGWHSEVNDFTYNGVNTKMVGHYTQIVWANSTKVGCGYANCGSNGHLYVCNYGPAGNLQSSRYKPYTSGTSCNKCQGRCSNKLCVGEGANVCGEQLCLLEGDEANDYPESNSLSLSFCSIIDCSGLVCLNGGTMNLNTCTCTCKTQSHYVGNQCALDCSLLSQPSTCSFYTAQQCSIYGNVPFDCPQLCSICPYGGIAYQATTTATTAPPSADTTTTLTTAGTTTTLTTAGTTKDVGGTSKMAHCVVPSLYCLVLLLFLNGLKIY